MKPTTKQIRDEAINAATNMESYKVIMEHWQTHKIMFLIVTGCKDMDECIEHVKRKNPDHNIERITPLK